MENDYYASDSLTKLVSVSDRISDAIAEVAKQAQEGDKQLEYRLNNLENHTKSKFNEQASTNDRLFKMLEEMSKTIKHLGIALTLSDVILLVVLFQNILGL